MDNQQRSICNWKILRKYNVKHSTYIAYHAELECQNCGNIINIRSENIKKIACSKCKQHNKQQEIVGKIINNYLILQFVKQIQHKQYYLCKCLNCGRSIIKRKDGLGVYSKCLYCKGNGKTPTLDGPRNVLKYHYMYNAKLYNRIFDLSDAEFNDLIFGHCFYCGQKPILNKSDKRYNKTKLPFKRNGIDRIDSNLGYTKDNCVSCCFKCNSMKSDMNINDFISHVNKINQYINKRSTTISKESTSKQMETEGVVRNNDNDIVYSE